MLTKFLDPKNDVAFKKIFGTEKNKDILIHFLNDMITFKQGGKIKQVTFLQPVQDPETAILKTSIVDILCKDDQGNTCIVEMQVVKDKGFEKTAQLYAAKAYSSQLYINGKYHSLKEVIFLAISNFTMFPNKTAYKSDQVILDKQPYENNLKDFSFTFLELPKFSKNIDELSNRIEKWAYFFKHAEETSKADLQILVKGDRIIKKAYQELDRFSWNEEELRSYEQTEKWEGTYLASLEQKFDEGMEKGIEIGIQQCIEKGIEKGRKTALLDMAKLMLERGDTVTSVIAITGLSEEDIRSIL